MGRWQMLHAAESIDRVFCFLSLAFGQIVVDRNLTLVLSFHTMYW